MPGVKSKEADKDPIFASTDQSWRLHNPKFFETSVKYAKKPDYQQKHVGVPWSIVDPNNLVNYERSSNSIGHDQSGGLNKFSQYESMNPHQKYRTIVKDNLRREINDIAIDLAFKRESTLKFKPRDPMN